MDTEQLKFVIQASVNSMSQQLAAAHITPPEVQAYAPIEICIDIRFDEPLDAVKCLPEVAGAHESYVS